MVKISPKTVVISIGMQRAGSAWYFNLTHDLWVAAGGQDAHQIRARYHLEKILTEANCNMGKLSLANLLPVLRPAFDGNSYVIKSHEGPTLLVRLLLRLGWLKLTYIYRDPRDAALSAHEFGQRVLREKGRPNAFSSLNTIEKALNSMVRKCRNWQRWMKVPGILITTYEDLITNYDSQVRRLAAHLGLDLSQAALQAVVEKHRPGKSFSGQTRTHYYKGQIGRFRQSFTLEQKQYALDLLGPYLKRMGYPLE